jgi:redox-sensitive bicupin YhaK (pirin superfamily)
MEKIMTAITDRRITQTVIANSFTHGTGFEAFSIGQRQFGSSIQPFIQLDHYFMTQPTFPEHPHQGIAAVTYMFEDSEGTFFNTDSQGDKSYIRPGDLHWTQAGTGIRHEETPIESGKVCHGIQMFVDLPPADKLAPPQALHLSAAEIPTYTTPEGGRVRVVIGTANNVSSPLKISSKINFLDVILPANSYIEHEIDADKTAFICAVKGAGTIGDNPITDRSGVLFDRAALPAVSLASERLQIRSGAAGLQYILCIG